MIYPKPVMRIKELKAMGIPETTLMRIYRTRGQKAAWKISPGKSNSPIVFDTNELDRILGREMRAQDMAIIHGCAMKAP